MKRSLRHVSAVLSVGLCLILSRPATAAATPTLPVSGNAPLSRADSLAERLRKANAFSGVILVGKDGSPVFMRSYGFADVKRHVPVNADTRFILASAGKMFTTVAILQLVSRGQLSLDDTVGKVLPDYPNADVAKKVTVRHLLTHSGGTGDIAIFRPEDSFNREHIRELRDFIPIHATQPLEFEPGTQSSYSNYGFILLGLMIERLSGQTYRDYLESHIFKPAGMSHTGFPAKTEVSRDLAIGYTQRWPDPNAQGPLVDNWESLPWRGSSAGGGASTAPDLLRFVNALQSGKLVPPSVLKSVTEPAQERPLGFQLVGSGRHFNWGHSGASFGMNVEVRTYPGSGYTIIVLANRDPAVALDIANTIEYGLLDPDHVPVFLRGSMNGWSTDLSFTRMSDGSLTADIELAAGAHEFKMGSGGWTTVDLGAASPVKIDGEVSELPLKKSGGNLVLSVRTAGTYRFTARDIDGENPRLSVKRRS